MTWPNSSLSSSVSGTAAQLTATNAPALRRLRLVQRARHQLLARAALAGDQHRGVGLGDAVDQVVDLSHRRAVADDLARQCAAIDFLAQALDLRAQRAVLHGAFEREFQLFELERFADEVVSARADRGHGGLHAAERGDHDHRHVRSVGDDALAQREAVHAAHVEIGHDDVYVFALDERKRFVGGGLPRRVESGAPQRRLHRLAQILIVIDDEDAALHSTHEFRTANYSFRH